MLPFPPPARASQTFLKEGLTLPMVDKPEHVSPRSTLKPASRMPK